MPKAKKINPLLAYKQAMAVGEKVRVTTEIRGKVSVIEGTVSAKVGNTSFSVTGEHGVVWLSYPTAKRLAIIDGAFESETPGVSRVRVEVLNGKG